MGVCVNDLETPFYYKDNLTVSILKEGKPQPSYVPLQNIPSRSGHLGGLLCGDGSWVAGGDT